MDRSSSRPVKRQPEGPRRGIQRWMRLLLIAIFVVPMPGSASVLFATAYSEYQAGDYPAARAALAELAALGQPASQALYGQMLVKGQGGPVALGAGFGWMQAAAGNGSTESLNQLEKIKTNIARLPPEEQEAASRIVLQYRRATLEAELLPTLSDLQPCPGTTAVDVFEIVLPTYPATARRWGSDADVLIEVRVGVDGLAREPHILAWFAEADLFNEPAMRAALRSRFRPATRDGVAVEGSYWVKVYYRIEGGGSLWDHAGIARASAMAAQGDSLAEYLVGSGGLADPSAFHSGQRDATSYMLRSAQEGHPPAQAWLADQLRMRSGCPPSPKAARWLEIAARGGDPNAELVRARDLLGAAEPGVEARAEAKRLLLAVAASDSVFAVRQAAAILASSPYEDVRDATVALESMRRLKTGDYDPDPLTSEALAAALAANGRTAEAASREEHALKLADEYRWNTSAIRERLATYRKGRAWTGDLFALPPVPPPGPPPSNVTPCDERIHKTECLKIINHAAP